MTGTDHLAEPIRLTLELDRDAEPPSEWIEDEHGEPRAFEGLSKLILLDASTWPQQWA